MRRLCACAGLWLAATFATANSATVPDHIFVNARVWTADAARPTADAFAVTDGRFVAVGTNETVRRSRDRRPRSSISAAGASCQDSSTHTGTCPRDAVRGSTTPVPSR